MIIRYMSSAGIGIMVTTALLWSMNALIDLGERVDVPVEPHQFLDWIRADIDTPVQTIVEPPPRVPDPVAPPESRPPVDPGVTTIPVGVPTAPTAPAGPDIGSGLSGNIDSGLINIITGQPEYPIVASQKGMEGYVIVRFDVTAIGTVENVEIVESSSSVFNKAAVKAAYRSKYKPKTVDGVSFGTQGLRKMFRFEMKSG